jgi:hypothetical protein
MCRVCHDLPSLADRNQILSISIYWEFSDKPIQTFGKRATVFSGRAPLKDIFQGELSGQYVKNQQFDVDWGTNTLVHELESGQPEPTRGRGKMLVAGKTLGLPYLPG